MKSSSTIRKQQLENIQKFIKEKITGISEHELSLLKKPKNLEFSFAIEYNSVINILERKIDFDQGDMEFKDKLTTIHIHYKSLTSNLVLKCLDKTIIEAFAKKYLNCTNKIRLRGKIYSMRDTVTVELYTQFIKAVKKTMVVREFEKVIHLEPNDYYILGTRLIQLDQIPYSRSYTTKGKKYLGTYYNHYFGFSFKNGQLKIKTVGKVCSSYFNEYIKNFTFTQKLYKNNFNRTFTIIMTSIEFLSFLSKFKKNEISASKFFSLRKVERLSDFIKF